MGIIQIEIVSYKMMGTFLMISSQMEHCDNRELKRAICSEPRGRAVVSGDLRNANEAILLVLSDESFSSVPSVRQITGMICVLNSTVYRRLVDSLHFAIRHQTSEIRHQTSDIRHQTSLFVSPHAL
jgi:hypothetical protein